MSSPALPLRIQRPGMEFQEVREYVPGDDIRAIDWNVTARTGIPHVKKFTEERELTVMLLVDISASNLFGSTTQLKRDLIAEVAAVLAFSAITNHDRVGLILFSDRVEKHSPPAKGPTHVLRVISEINARPASPAPTSPPPCLPQPRRPPPLRRLPPLRLHRPLRPHPARHRPPPRPRQHRHRRQTRASLPVGLVDFADAETGRRILRHHPSHRRALSPAKPTAASASSSNSPAPVPTPSTLPANATTAPSSTSSAPRAPHMTPPPCAATIFHPWKKFPHRGK